MTTNENMHTSNDERNLQTRTVDFEGQAVTAVHFRGRWLWRGAEVGGAIGYEQGRKLVANIRGEWAADFREGTDFELLRGDDLRAFKRLCTAAVSSGVDRSPALLVLTESGIDRALILSRTDKGRRLRDLLVDHVLPQLRATGTATLPGAPPPPTLDAAALRDLIAQTVAEQLRALGPQGLLGVSPVLDRRDHAAALGPMLRMARVVAGPGATAREVARERGRIEHRVRLALRWDARWCLFPTAREGELVLALREEERLVERIAERAARDRQLSLRVVGGAKDSSP